MKTLAAFAIVTALATAAALAADTAPITMTANDYSDGANWLCLPGRADDACGAAKEDATIVTTDGTLIHQAFAPDPDAPVDCFYVYPTISLDPGVLSDMKPGKEELTVIQHQFARFATKCKPYAPVYRQYTMTALIARALGRPMEDKTAEPGRNYKDVLDAWNYYLKHYNSGRGVVLVGHSQGSGVLQDLIRNEIEGKTIQKRILSAMLMGTRLDVPRSGRGVGGGLKRMALCKSPAQLGCVIAYASFRDTLPPTGENFFVKTQNPKMMAACANPAALGGGEGPAYTYFGTTAAIANANFKTDWSRGKAVTTAFVSTPGLVTAQCKTSELGPYLAISVHGDPGDPRTDDIPGDVVIGSQVQAMWGLHLIDANLFMGNLLEIVAQETESYLKKNPSRH